MDGSVTAFMRQYIPDTRAASLASRWNGRSTGQFCVVSYRQLSPSLHELTSGSITRGTEQSATTDGACRVTAHRLDSPTAGVGWWWLGDDAIIWWWWRPRSSLWCRLVPAEAWRESLRRLMSESLPAAMPVIVSHSLGEKMGRKPKIRAALDCGCRSATSRWSRYCRLVDRLDFQMDALGRSLPTSREIFSCSVGRRQSSSRGPPVARCRPAKWAARPIRHPGSDNRSPACPTRNLRHTRLG